MNIDIGKTADGRVISLPLSRLNRHMLVTGSTGGGKTVTLQRIMEQCSANGIPVFASDVKSDLSGIATNCQTQFWDLFGRHGLPIRTSVQAMGSELLSSMLRLNETQAGTLAIAFRKAEDEKDFMLTLDDLRYVLVDMIDNRDEISHKYGNVTGSSINAIQRNLMTLESQGGEMLFGEPPFDILDLLRGQLDFEGGVMKGVVNLLHADKLIEAPKLYATFLLWLLTELFRKLPEAGDLPKPKIVFVFDEAHLLFTDSPKPLIQQIERLVRLVRSKGVGVIFVTQSVADVPETVLAQLGSKIQHALRVYTPRDQTMVKATIKSFRPNRGVDVKEVTTLGIGEAFISVIEADGVPTKVERVKVELPAGQIGPLSTLEREIVNLGSSLRVKYTYSASEGEAAKQFDNRMRAERGLPILEPTGAWMEGDFAKYVVSPSAPPQEARDARRRIGRTKMLQGVVALAVSVVLIAIAIH